MARRRPALPGRESREGYSIRQTGRETGSRWGPFAKQGDASGTEADLLADSRRGKVETVQHRSRSEGPKGGRKRRRVNDEKQRVACRKRATHK